MIDVDLYLESDQLTAFRVRGHADYAESGQDIVCAAVSILVYNAVNSCERFAGVSLQVMDVSNQLSCRVPQPHSKEAQLLLRSMVFGIEQLIEQYPEHVQMKTHIQGDM